MDENYQIHLNRILRMTLPDTYQTQVQHIQPSPKFQRRPEGGWQAVSFPGYTVITPPGTEDSKNADLYTRLEQYQYQSIDCLGSDLLIPVPPSSFHLTLADVIWDSAYRHASQDPTFDQVLRRQVAESFQQCDPFLSGEPIRFQVVGLMVMARALAAALAATDEMGYYKILNMRRSIYQNSGLMGIGIEQQYYFTPHITLGYFGDLSAVDRGQLSQQFEALNQIWVGAEPQEFWVYEAQLRQFPDMTLYTRAADWPVLRF